MATAEEIGLTEIVVALGTRAMFTGCIDRREQPRANRACRYAGVKVRLWTFRRACKRVAGTGLHERLEYALVRQPQVKNLAERVERPDPTSELCARREDGIDRTLPETFDCGEAETDALAVLDREIQLAFVDVRRQHRDA